MSKSEKKEILQNDRYSDYMELYNNDEDAVWEELIADVFANMNDYSENYIDTVVDYWYNNDTSIGYNPSEYIQITDAGGEYSLSNDIPYNEKRQLDDYILRKNYSDNKLEKVDCKEIGNNFNVWENNSKNDYDVVFMVEIDGNEDLINDLRGEIKNGTNRFTKQFGSAYARRGGNGGRRNNMLNAVYQRRKSANGNGRISSGQSGSDTGRRITESGGNTQADKKTRYSLTSDGGNDGFSDEWHEKLDTYGAIPKGGN